VPEIKQAVRVLRPQVMKKYDGVEVLFHALLNSASDKAALGREGTPNVCQLDKMLDGPQSPSGALGRKETSLGPPAFSLDTVPTELSRLQS